MARKTKSGGRASLAGFALELATIVGLIGFAQPELVAEALNHVDTLVGRSYQEVRPVATPAIGHINDLPPSSDLVLPPVIDRRDWLPGYFDVAAAR